MRFLLGSSFFEGGKGGATARQLFSVIWWENVKKANPAPDRIVVVCEGNSKLGFKDPRVDVVNLSGNLGHCGQLLSGEKPYEFSSWSSSMCALAMLAYDNESDFIYQESDCLAFGPWVRQMYEDLGDGDIVFGPRHTSAPWMPCSQSLFLVKHRFLPKFVSMYLSFGGERDHRTLGEAKFQMIREEIGHDRAKLLSFGVDRCRPLPFDANVWYCQQNTPEEIEELKRRGLI